MRKLKNQITKYMVTSKYIHLITFFIVSFLALYFVKVQLSDLVLIKVSKETTPKVIYKNKEEIVLTYIGSSTCSFCNNPNLNNYLKEVDKSMRRFSKKNFLNYISVGISNEHDIYDGIKHLINFDINFDEISTGNNWNNTSINYYINQHESILATPQIIISKRIYQDTLHINAWNPIIDEFVVARYVGLEMIDQIDTNKVFLNLKVN